MGRRQKGDGCVYWSSSKKLWVAQYNEGYDENGKLIKRTIYSKSKDEINKKLKEIQYMQLNGTYIERNGITLAELIDSIRENKYKANIIGHQQYARLKTTANKIKKNGLSLKKVQDIKAYDIQNFLNDNIELSDSYLSKIMEVLNGAFKKAIKLRIIKDNPMEDIIKPKSKTEQKEIRALTLEEQTAFTKYLKNSTIEENRFKVCFLIEMYMGLRIGEVLALNSNDVNFKEGYIKITKTLTKDIHGNVMMGNTTKTFAGKRIVPIPDTIKEEVKEQVKLSKNNKDNLLFTINNNYVKGNTVNYELKQIFTNMLEMSADEISTHVLRHTFATRCIEGGMSPVALQRLMGHTDISITLNTYTSVFNRYKEEEINKVNKYLSKKVFNEKTEEIEY